MKHSPMAGGDYGLGRSHCEDTKHGMHIAGGMSQNKAHDKDMQNIGGGKNALATGDVGLHQSRMRSQDNPNSDKKQPHGTGTGEGKLGTSTGNKLPIKTEPHRFSGHDGKSHGFGHSATQRSGKLRMSGSSNSHRVGSRKK